MQYVLTEIEYTDLKNQKDALVDVMKIDLQVVCTYAADNIPIKYWDRTEASPWGCILSADDSTEWYCDECPTQNQCPYEDKQWSK